MSWSFYAAGTPDALRTALAVAVTQYGEPSASNPSRLEFDQARGAIETVLAMNQTPCTVEASGHGTYSDGQKTGETCTLKIVPIANWIAR